MPIVKKLRRECKKCGDLFEPTGKSCWTCDECWAESKKNREIKIAKVIMMKKLNSSKENEQMLMN